MNTNYQNNHSVLRHDWTREEILDLFSMPFNDLIFEAQSIHRQNFDPNEVQISSLLSIKTGSCPEDCSYCPQSAHYDTGLQKEKLLEVIKVIDQARRAKEMGATRFCMGAAWKHPHKRDMPYILDMIKGVRELGMETCMTLGMLTADQAHELKEAGLDYYNHNLDTSPEYYSHIISTRTYEDRLETLEYVRDAGINVCCGGILGMGETVSDRAGLLQQLANLPAHPESVPINKLIRIKGTPLEDVEELEPLDFVRTIAAARIMMPKSYVRIAAGREYMSDETQALCFMAGANSIFYGEKLLTSKNPAQEHDMHLLRNLGIRTAKGLTDKPMFERHEIIRRELIS